MPDALGYADAVRLLGGEKSRLVDWFDKLTAGTLLVAAVPVPALLGIFDARTEFVRLGHELVRGVAEKRSGLSRYGRTRRLEAAHAVIAVTAFFEQLGELDLPFGVGDLRIGRSEQLILAGARPADDLTAALFATPAPVPGPHLPYPALRSALVGYYQELVVAFLTFLRGLAIADTLFDRRWRATEQALGRLPESAADRHRDLLTQLAADFPEVSFWLGLHEHEATRQELHRLSLGLAEMQRVLVGISTGRAPDDRRAALGVAYAAELRRPIIASGDVPAGLTVPSLGEAYVPPLCRIAELGPNARPSDESWWEGRPVRDDLWQALVVHLTSPGATRAPLLVLGQPGSGKSVLTRVVAAQLPAADFLVVRVTLRDVHAAGDLQDQIEQAIRNDTGERLDWPTLSRSAKDALPVVLLDGFDELLQATGVSQTDYLRRVAAFQRREADQGRPVAVLVTSRTSVADRAPSPPGTIAVRLEPFDEPRVGTWVETWNRVNRAAFRALGARPLDREIVLSHRELATQPLLLLMLALYDAEGGDLRQAGELRRWELYERLLSRFARREVVKERDGLPDRELSRAVEEELRRLAVVAFAMFNRGAQWVTATELDGDLAALPLSGAPARERPGLRVPLAAAEVVLGRFFFIHRSRAALDERRRETYEFLHATFGEYLVARLTAEVVDDLVARDAAASLSWRGGSGVDDDLLHALLSYAVLSTRATVLAFLGEGLAGRSTAHRDAWADLLLRLFREVPYTAGARRFDDYRPRRLRVPARYAAYSANLLLLALAAGGSVTGRRLFPEAADPVAEWRAQVRLWHSQLDTEAWDGLVDLLALERLGDGVDRDVRIWSDDRRATPPDLDVVWSLGVPSRTGTGYGFPRARLARLRRTAHLTCEADAVMVVHALEPMFDKLSTAIAAFYDVGESVIRSAAHTLVDAWLVPLRPASGQERQDVYLRCVRLLNGLAGLIPDWDRAAFLRLLLDRIAADREASADVVTEVLSACDTDLLRDREVSAALMRSVRAVLGAGDEADVRLAEALGYAYDAHLLREEWLDDAAAEVVLRLHEQGLVAPQVWASAFVPFELRYGHRRPDLVRRLRPFVVDPAELAGKRRQHGVASEVEADS
ncbi:NACHT domain-containing protein [Micromonospora avicenniae]|uniref:NACHT domain-containing protein n=1 Tax=Micromonospora avicenniae TaxID=1198245 RepID=UPI0033242279